MVPSQKQDGPPRGLKARWIDWRNRLLSSPRFQRTMAAIPVARFIARKRAARQFDLISGFVQSQILFACVESGLLDALADGPVTRDALGDIARLEGEGLERLLRAGAAVDLLEPLDADWWQLGQLGAELVRNESAKAMIRHHAVFYRDLSDPLALLRDDRNSKSELAAFWDYRPDGEAAPYSALMAASQPMVHDEMLRVFPFHKHARMLDVGGGSGALIEAVAKAAPTLQFGHADLEPVSRIAKERLAPLGDRVRFHVVDFHDGALPAGYDLICFSRVLHDHDDEAVQALLDKAADALAPGGTLLIAEPLAQTAGAEVMGDAYFGLYLWAMGRGRPRTREEYAAMTRRAGFRGLREVATYQPLIVRLLTALR